MDWDDSNGRYEKYSVNEYQNFVVPHKYKYRTLDYCTVTVYYCHGKRHAACCDKLSKDIYIY